MEYNITIVDTNDLNRINDLDTNYLMFTEVDEKEKGILVEMALNQGYLAILQKN